MKYQYVLMDADETLFDFKKSMRKALTETYVKYGIEVTEENINYYAWLNDHIWERLERKEITKKELIETRFRILCEHFNVKHPGGTEMEMFYQDALSKGHDLMPDADAVCGRLCRHVHLYLVTNGTAVVQRRRIEECGLKDFFQGIFISEDIGVNKPHKEYFEYVYEAIGRPPKQDMIIVGDSMTSDIKGGYDFGIDTCHIVTETPEYTDIVPTYTIHGLRELYDILY